MISFCLSSRSRDIFVPALLNYSNITLRNYSCYTYKIRRTFKLYVIYAYGFQNTYSYSYIFCHSKITRTPVLNSNS